MFINDRLIYLQMRKTGCTHITKLLSNNLDGEMRAKHSKLTFDPGKRVIIGSVRNPWDWYVSLWAFGCSGKGAFFHKITKPNETAKTLARLITSSFPNPRVTFRSFNHWLRTPERNYEKWKHLYGDPMDVGLFREWIKYGLSDTGKAELIEYYPYSKLSTFAGFMTYRFVSLYSNNREWNTVGKYIDNQADLREFFDRQKIIDRIVHMENLEQDLLQILRDIGYELTLIEEKNRTNSSKHLSYKKYYDQETEELVAAEEKFIIDEYGYVCPGEREDVLRHQRASL